MFEGAFLVLGRTGCFRNFPHRYDNYSVSGWLHEPGVSHSHPDLADCRELRPTSYFCEFDENSSLQ